MQAALLVNPVMHNWKTNLAVALKMVREAAHHGSQFVLLGEMAITGMVNNDDLLHDLPLSERIPGPFTVQFQETASRLGIWLGFGLLERDRARIYDTAVLLSPSGEIKLKYRRMQPQWHGKAADPAVYAQGTEIQKVETDFGSVVFLICGDLWDDGLRRRAREMRPDWVLHPYARCFADGSRDQTRWERDEIPQYQSRVADIGAPVLATSYVCAERFVDEADAFGGAMQFDRDGKILAAHPLGQAGILYCELDHSREIIS